MITNAQVYQTIQGERIEEIRILLDLTLQK